MGGVYCGYMWVVWMVGVGMVGVSRGVCCVLCVLTGI